MALESLQRNYMMINSYKTMVYKCTPQYLTLRKVAENKTAKMPKRLKLRL
jgi:hypothetical protein